MSDQYYPQSGPGGQPDAHYQSMTDAQLLSIYEGSAINSPAYIAVMAELRSRGYSFNDPEPANQAPPPQQQYNSQPNMPPYQHQQYNSQPNMPPNQQQQYGAPQSRQMGFGTPPYSAGGTAGWQTFFVIIGIAVAGLLIYLMGKTGALNDTLKIVIPIAMGMMVMSSGFILSGVRHLANLKHGFHTASAPTVYIVFGGFWMLAFIALWISSLIDIIKVLEYSPLIALISLAVTAVLSMFLLVQYLVFKTLYNQLNE